MKYILLVASMLCSQLHAQQILTFQKQLNLIPEGIAIHPDNGTIYISSIAQKKIVTVMADGTSADFISEGQDGFLEGLGMKVDKKRSFLWALSNTRNGN